MHHSNLTYEVIL